jgi:hypothetical protein
MTSESAIQGHRRRAVEKIAAKDASDARLGSCDGAGLVKRLLLFCMFFKNVTRPGVTVYIPDHRTPDKQNSPSLVGLLPLGFRCHIVLDREDCQVADAIDFMKPSLLYGSAHDAFIASLPQLSICNIKRG